MPAAAGPGRTSATAWMTRSIVVAPICCNSVRIAGDSTWKHPSVPPLLNSLAVRASSSGIVCRSGTTTPWPCNIVTQSCTIESARLPSKSILTMPSPSTKCMSYCVTTTPLAARSSGAYVATGCGVITRPPGCTPRWRGADSSCCASDSSNCSRSGGRCLLSCTELAARLPMLLLAVARPPVGLPPRWPSRQNPGVSAAISARSKSALPCHGKRLLRRTASAGGKPITLAASWYAERGPHVL